MSNAPRVLILARNVVVGAALLIVLAPLLLFYAQAFRPPSGTGTVPAAQSGVSTANFSALFGRVPNGGVTSGVAYGFGRTILNSLATAVLVAVMTLIVGSPAGLAIGRGGSLRWQSILALFGAVGVPPVVIVIPVLLLLRQLGLYGTRASIVVVHVALALPLAIAIVASQDVRLLQRQDEVASLDGLPRFWRVRRLAVPALAPALAVAGLLSFLMSYTEFFFALILTTPETRTAPVVIAGFETIRGVQWGLVSAAAVVLTLPGFLVLGVLWSLARLRRVLRLT
jgi:ABC-type glycerol-3-phosphate transport system permease component